MRDLRSLMIDDFLTSQAFSSGVYVAERISTGIRKTVTKSMNIPKHDLIKVVFDATFFGSAKNGFVVSADGLYWREFYGSPQFVNWEAISIAQTRRRLSFRTSELSIENAVVTMSLGSFSMADVEKVLNGILFQFHSAFVNTAD